jgi:secreted trypsin-like serine protease
MKISYVFYSVVKFALIVTVFTSCSSGSNKSNDDNSPSLSDKESCNIIGLIPKIIGGRTCQSPEKSAIVRVIEVTANDVTGICTGSLIAPSIVLTAAHCINDSAFRLGAVDYIIIIGEPGNAQGVISTLVSIPPGFGLPENSDRLFNDVALLTLEKPFFNITPLPILASRQPKNGEDGFVYGYGKRVEGESEAGIDAATLEAGSMRVEEVTPNHIFVEFQKGGVNVCNGDSGGPLIVLVDGTPAIAGVVSQGSVLGCYPGDVTTFTNLQSEQVYNWLKTVEKAVTFR